MTIGRNPGNLFKNTGRELGARMLALALGGLMAAAVACGGGGVLFTVVPPTPSNPTPTIGTGPTPTTVTGPSPTIVTEVPQNIVTEVPQNIVTEVPQKQQGVASLEVQPGTLSLEAGQDLRLTATVRDAQGTELLGRAVTWSSDNPSVALVGIDTGLVKALSPGNATISASFGGQDAKAIVTVLSTKVGSVEVQPGTLSLTLGQDRLLTATVRDAQGTMLPGRAVTWSSDNAAVATVDSVTGLVKAISLGNATISASYEGQVNTAIVTVARVEQVGLVDIQPKTLTLLAGQEEPLIATVKSSQGQPLADREVTWASNNESVATVVQVDSTTGRVKAIGPGEATIEAFSEGRSGEATVTVLASCSEKVLQGDAFYNQGQFQKAIDSYFEAIRLCPQDARTYHKRGQTYIGLGELRVAILDFDEVIRREPGFSAAWYDRAQAHFNLRQFQKAVQDFDEAIRQNSLKPESFHGRGLAYYNLGQFQRSIQDFDEAIKLNIRYDSAFSNRGLAYSHLGQWQRAKADYNEAIRLNPQYAQAFYNRGLAGLGLTQFEDAISDFDKAIGLFLKFQAAYVGRGIAYYRKGQCELAIGDFSEAIRLKPIDATALGNRAVAYTCLGEHQKAIDDWDEVIGFNAEDDFAYNSRGLAYVSQGKHERAKLDFDEATRINPGNCDAYFNRARVNFTLGNDSEGTKDITKGEQCESRR